MAKSIAIIGAGIAGLSAAQTLRGARCKVSVFDKSRGSGGRLASKRSAFGNLDLGAQYFTARERNFSAQVEHWHQQGLIDTWQPHLYQSNRTGLSHSADEQHRWAEQQGWRVEQTWHLDYTLYRTRNDLKSGERQTLLRPA